MPKIRLLHDDWPEHTKDYVLCLTNSAWVRSNDDRRLHSAEHAEYAQNLLNSPNGRKVFRQDPTTGRIAPFQLAYGVPYEIIHLPTKTLRYIASNNKPEENYDACLRTLCLMLDSGIDFATNFPLTVWLKAHGMTTRDISFGQ